MDLKHIRNLWDDHQAATLAGDDVALLIYRSNLLGSDLKLTNYGGGNTSCKASRQNPLTTGKVEILYVKGSGGDLGTLTKSGLASLYLDKLHSLETIYRGPRHEDEMVSLLDHCLFELTSRAPSIDTPLHGFLPFRHIDHLHPDSVIAIAAAAGGEQITRTLFNGAVGWVDWQRPGFDLGLKLRACLHENPQARGIILGSHGLFTWGNTSKECYENTLEVIDICSSYVEEAVEKKGIPFGGAKTEPLSPADRRKQASRLAPVLRGFCSSKQSTIMHFTDDQRVLDFVTSRDLERLAELGTSCPDHFLRTKISPLVLDLDPDDDLTEVHTKLQVLFEKYRAMYTAYYEDFRTDISPAMRDPNPVVILYPGVGMFTFSKDKQTARISAEFYLNAIEVIRGAEAISSYQALPRSEAFEIEYWSLEEAKLRRMPPPKALSGKIALVTGSAGGIGKAIARRFAREGAVVMLSDNDPQRLVTAKAGFLAEFGRDAFSGVSLDVCKPGDVEECLAATTFEFGGLDILVNCAGLSISKPLLDHTVSDWDLLYDVLVRGQFLMTQAAVAVLRKQNIGGDVVNIVSKNALVSGPNNAAYGSAKAAQLHLSRLNAAELGPDSIRVNVVNPDAVIADSKIWEGEWAEGRAKAYGITVAEIPAYYARRTLLGVVILPEDIASACFALVGGLLKKSTGNVINVDGGVSAAFVR